MHYRDRTRANCRHCQTWRVIVARQMCRMCWNNRCVRERYPLIWPQCVPGKGDTFAASKIPAEATRAMPGSAEKIAVMTAREARGESLFHTDDGPIE